MLISPAFTVGMLLATLYGALTHLIVGGDGGRLVATIAAAWVGFGIGHGIGQVMQIHALSIGPLNVLTATFGALIATSVASFLAAYRKG